MNFNSESESIQIIQPEILNKYIDDENFPFLISFPRTGSHWLRMLMELYFEKPSLVRSFYYKNPQHFTCFHRHDDDLDIERKNVIYLYREPVDTIFSQMSYYLEDHDDIARIEYWADRYGRHLSKWLLEEKFTAKKTILTYEGLNKSLDKEFQKLCDHFGVAFNRQKLDFAKGQVSKKEVKKKTVHDKQVINLSEQYQNNKIEFTKTYNEVIMNIIYDRNNQLKAIL